MKINATKKVVGFILVWSPRHGSRSHCPVVSREKNGELLYKQLFHGSRITNAIISSPKINQSISH